MATTMIAIPCKDTDKIDFVKPLSKYVKSNFGDEVLSDHLQSIETLQQLREEIRFGTEKTEASRARLLSYLGLVQCAAKHFPISEDNIRLYFYWYDCVSKKRCGQYGLDLEKISIKFCCGALESQIAALCNRSTEDGIRIASSFFLRAAGTFDSIREELLSGTLRLLSPTLDLTGDYMAMLQTLMLAQAQECFFEKASRNNMNPSITAKLAAGAAGLYQTALTAMQSPALKSSIDPTWCDHVMIRVAIYSGIGDFNASHEFLAQRKFGVQVAYLERAVSYFTAVNPRQLSKVAPDVAAAFTTKQQMITRAFSEAQNDNNRIYHESVPSSIPAIEQKVMVKQQAFVDPMPVGSENPFLRLVPLAVSQSLTVYEERKNTLTRQDLDQIEEQNSIAKSSLCSMNLPGALLALDNPTGIPPTMNSQIESFRQVGGIRRIEELCETLEKLADEDRVVLEDSLLLLDREEEEDNQMRQNMRQQWTRTPSHQLTANLRQEAAKFRLNIEHARKSDAYVRRKFEDHKPILARLSGGPAELQSLFPPVVGPPDTINQQYVGQLKELMCELDKVISNREELHTRLKATRDSDDITATLMNTMTPHELVFEQELRKYDEVRQQLQENFSSQDKLLQQISDANAAFIRNKGASPQQARRDQALQAISNALTNYSQLEGNLVEGIQFYTNFQELLSKFKQKCSDFTVARKSEKQDLIAQMTAAATGINSGMGAMPNAQAASFMPGMQIPGMVNVQMAPVPSHAYQTGYMQPQFGMMPQAHQPQMFQSMPMPQPVAMLPGGQIVQLPPGYVLPGQQPPAAGGQPGQYRF